VEEYDENQNNTLEEVTEMEEDGNTESEPGNNSNNDNIQEEITGMGEVGHGNIESIFKRRKRPSQIYDTGRYKYHIRNEHKQ